MNPPVRMLMRNEPVAFFSLKRNVSVGFATFSIKRTNFSWPLKELHRHLHLIKSSNAEITGPQAKEFCFPR